MKSWRAFRGNEERGKGWVGVAMRGNVHIEKVIDKHNFIGRIYEHPDVKTIHVLL